MHLDTWSAFSKRSDSSLTTSQTNLSIMAISSYKVRVLYQVNLKPGMTSSRLVLRSTKDGIITSFKMMMSLDLTMSYQGTDTIDFTMHRMVDVTKSEK